jgi:hypothetical protein
MIVSKIVKNNRSLAENDPMNLAHFTACKIYIELNGQENFISYVNKILDLTE